MTPSHASGSARPQGRGSRPPDGRRAVFLDRDGVLTVPEFRDGRSYAPRTLAAFRLYEDAAAAVARLRTAGLLTVVVTNQPDVAYGLMPAEVLEAMHRRLGQEVPVDAIEACLHGRDDGCDCRKPGIGMFRRAAGALGISLADSYMVGDRRSDMEAARAAGCAAVFVDLQYSKDPKPTDVDVTVDGIRDAVSWILERERRRAACVSFERVG